MKILVTGGAGFIGSHLVDALVGRKNQVRVLDNLSTGDIRNLAPVVDRIEFIKGDLRNERVLKKAVQGVEVIFHQGALRSVPKSVDNPVEYHQVNATATLHLLRFAKEFRVRKVVYASSSSVYGDRTALPQKEEMTPFPQSPYAASKLVCEVYAGLFTRLHGLQTVGLRYFNVFGPRQSLENQYAVVVPKFITCLLTNRPPPVHGDGRQTRDFTFVKEIVQANLRAAVAPRASGQVFNIANGERHSVLDLYRVLSRQTGAKVKPVFLPPRLGDVLHTWADIRKAKNLLGFTPRVGFVNGLVETVAWFDRNRQAWGGPAVR